MSKAPAQSKTAALTPTADTNPVRVEVKCPTVEEVKISYDPSADQAAMTATGLSTLREVCSKACVSSVKITSTARDVKDQARIMYDMIKAKGAAYVNALYGAGGKKIVSVYEGSVKDKLSEPTRRRQWPTKWMKSGPATYLITLLTPTGSYAFSMSRRLLLEATGQRNGSSKKPKRTPRWQRSLSRQATRPITSR